MSVSRRNNIKDDAENKSTFSASNRYQQQINFAEEKPITRSSRDNDKYSSQPSYQDVADFRTSFYDKNTKSTKNTNAKYFRNDRVATFWYSLGYGKPKHQHQPLPAKVIGYNNIDSTYTIELERNNEYIDDVPETELEIDSSADDKHNITDIKKPLIRLAMILNPNLQNPNKIEFELNFPLGSQVLHHIIKLLGDKYVKELKKSFNVVDRKHDGEITISQVMDVVEDIQTSDPKKRHTNKLDIDEHDILSWVSINLKKKLSTRTSSSFIEEKGSSSSSTSTKSTNNNITINFPEFILLYINVFHPIVGNTPNSFSRNEKKSQDGNNNNNNNNNNSINYTLQSQSLFFQNNEFKDITKFAATFGRKLIYELEDAFEHFAIVIKDDYLDPNSYDDYEEIKDVDLKRIVRNRKKLLLRNVLETFALMGRGLPLNVFQAW